MHPELSATEPNLEQDSGTKLRAAEARRDELVRQVVRRQMNQAGNILLSGLEPLSAEEFFAAGSNGISPAWTVGHLACVIDLFTSWVAGGRKALPDHVHAVFNSLEIGKKTLSKAELVDPTMFPQADILLLFRQSQVRALDVLRDFDLALWDAPTPESVPDTLPTYGAIWQALGVHTFWHLGELSGCIPRFHGTYTLNTVIHYFYTGSAPKLFG